MRKTLLIIGISSFVTGLFAQGTVNLQSFVSTGGGYSITFFSENYGDPGQAEIMGNRAGDLPAGTTTYPNETPLGGSSSGVGPGAAGEYNGKNYTVGFYFATSASGLQAAVDSGSPGYLTLMDTTSGNSSSGFYDASDSPIYYSIPDDPAGTSTYMAIAAWYSGGGSGSYAAAVAANYPRGIVFATSTIMPAVSSALAPTLANLGLTSFDLVVSPEPDTVILGAVGAFALLFRKRKLIGKKSLVCFKQ